MIREVTPGFPVSMLPSVTELPLPGRMLADAIGGDFAAPSESLPSFVAGPENALLGGAVRQLLDAATAVPNVAKRRRSCAAPSPLYLYGASGVGKTHLALGLVRYWQARRGEHTAWYTTAADFRHFWNIAVKQQAEQLFRAEHRGRDLIVIEDLQHLPADRSVLQELRYTLDDYAEREALVVLTSRIGVCELSNLGADIRGRVAAGLVLDVASAGTAARACIVQQIALALGNNFSTAAADCLARRFEGPVNQLYSVVVELLSVPGGPTGPPHGAEAQLQHVEQWLATHEARRPTLREVIRVVARHQAIPESQLKSNTRRQSTVYARGLVVYLARELANSTFEEIGRALGGRDHSTILHNHRKLRSLHEHDLVTRQTVEHLRRVLLVR